MLLFVEGCTCSGKSTFCQKFLNDTSNLCIMAPKHTPEIIANENPLERQIRVFKTYMENYNYDFELNIKYKLLNKLPFRKPSFGSVKL